MNDANPPLPELYREAAEELRQLARRARLTDIRGDLLELSAQFERQAMYADAAIRFGAPGYPHGEILPIASDRTLSEGLRGPSPTALRSRELGHNPKYGSSSKGSDWARSDPHRADVTKKSKQSHR